MTDLKHLSISVSLGLGQAARMVADPKQLAAAMLARLERGDADSSGSTIRTLFVVTLVTMIMPVITIGLIRLAGLAANHIDNTQVP